MEIRHVARVLASDDPFLSEMSVDGVRPRGRRLGDVLAEAGEQRLFRVWTVQHKETGAALFRATGKPEHRRLSQMSYQDVSVAHLAHLPADTRVLVGVEVDFSRDESRLLPRGPVTPKTS
jgi:hypothetical protein